MKKPECRKTVAAFLCLGILMMFSSCYKAEHQPDSDSEPQPTAPAVSAGEIKSYTEKSKATEDEPPGRPLSKVQESQETQENFLAQYIGRTVGDVVRDLGGEYIVDYYEGSTAIVYPGNLWFLFGSTEDTITDDLIIRQMFSSGQLPAVYGLAGSMTYPEIVEAVGEEAEVMYPEYFYNRMDDIEEYITGFEYREYYLTYTWLDNPESTASASVYVLKHGVDSSNLSDQSMAPEPTEETDHDDLAEGKPELFCGPGWFYGVMGSQFYIPDGFVQQDLTTAMGYDYLFKNTDLDMEISINEITFAMLGIDSSAMIDEYASREADDNVTYATSGDNFYVVSGYCGSDENAEIYYSRVDYDDTFRCEVDFQYPASQAEEGDKILIEFLENYSQS